MMVIPDANIKMGARRKEENKFPSQNSKGLLKSHLPSMVPLKYMCMGLSNFSLANYLCHITVPLIPPI